MDVRLLVSLSLGAAVLAAAVSIACLIRIEDLHREWRQGPGSGRRRQGALRGQGKVLDLRNPPPRR